MSKRVLVVEDNLAMRAVVRFNLQRAGFEVTVATDGLDGWRALEGHPKPIDIVVSDEQMPEMTGLELCRRMRDDERFAQVPLILLTAKGFELDAESLRRELGVVRLMAKPFSPRELVLAVNDALATAGEIRAEPAGTAC
jgi:CheY-like chemotaxis protein